MVNEESNRKLPHKKSTSKIYLYLPSAKLKTVYALGHQHLINTNNSFPPLHLLPCMLLEQPLFLNVCLYSVCLLADPSMYCISRLYQIGLCREPKGHFSDSEWERKGSTSSKEALMFLKTEQNEKGMVRNVPYTRAGVSKVQSTGKMWPLIKLCPACNLCHRVYK